MLSTVLDALGAKKWVAYGVAALAVAITAGLFVAHYEHLKQEAAAGAELKAEVAAISTHYACGSTKLGECLTARDLAGAKALLERVAAERVAAAAEQAELDRQNSTADAALEDAEAAIAAAPAGSDGTVPKVLSDSWRRERGAK